MIWSEDRTRLAVLGSPIAHSLSPAIHTAAYARLGLPWTYERHEVVAGGLQAFLDGLDASWRGLSLTMPLKGEALAAADHASELATLTGAVNTLVRLPSGLHGFNTDVTGMVTALRMAGIGGIERVHILGGGATAVSALAAAAELGAEEVTVSARRPVQAAEVAGRAVAFGLLGRAWPWEQADEPERADLVISTLPGVTGAGLSFPARLRASAWLFDVAYRPWPSPLAVQWTPERTVSGLEMLLHQAVAQVRIFLTGSEAEPLPDEPGLLAAMRAAAG